MRTPEVWTPRLVKTEYMYLCPKGGCIESGSSVDSLLTSYDAGLPGTAVASQEKVIPVKKEEPEERVSEDQSNKDQDEAMETEKEVDNKQQRQPVGPARPVQPAPVSAPPAEVHVRRKFVIYDSHIVFTSPNFNVLVRTVDKSVCTKEKCD